MQASDNFTGTNGSSLSSSWTKVTTSSLPGEIKIQSNQADGSGTWGCSVWNSACSTDAEFAQITARIPTGTSNLDVQVGVRCKLPAIGIWPDGYGCGVNYNNGTTTRYLFKYVSGSYTDIGGGTRSSPAYTQGEVIRLEANGSTITYYINGIPVTGFTVTDASISGTVNRQVYIAATGPLDDFSGGDLVPAVLPAFRSLSYLYYPPFGTNRTNTVIPAPAGIADGDILILAFTMGNAGSPPPTATLPTGFTQLQGTQVNDGTGYYATPRIAWKLAASESGSYTVTHASARTNGAIVCVSGGASSTPISSINSATTGTTVLSLSVTNPTYGSYLIHCGQIWDFLGVMTPPTGFTERYDATDAVLYISDKSSVPTGPTGDVSQTGPSSNPWVFFQICIIPSGIAPSPGGGGFFRFVSPRLVGIGVGTAPPPDPNPYAAGQVYSDTFDSYADAALLGNQGGWVNVNGGIVISNSSGTAGEVRSADNNLESTCNVATGAYNENQYAEVTIGTVGSGFPESGIGVVLNYTGSNYYACQWFINPSGAQSIYLWTLTGGDLAHTSWGSPTIPVAGDVMRFERSGTGSATRLRCYVNGSIKSFDNAAGGTNIGSSIDPGTYLSGGVPGISAQKRAGSSTFIAATSYRAGNL